MEDGGGHVVLQGCKRSGAAWFGAQRGFCDGRVFGPGVAGIGTAHVFANVGVRGGPEARQIGCDLNRGLGGGQQGDAQGLAGGTGGGVTGDAEHFLQADSDGRGFAVVIDWDAAAERGVKGGRDEVVQGGKTVVADQGFQGIGQVKCAQIGLGAPGGQMRQEPVISVGEKGFIADLWPGVITGERNAGAQAAGGGGPWQADLAQAFQGGAGQCFGRGVPRPVVKGKGGELLLPAGHNAAFAA